MSVLGSIASGARAALHSPIAAGLVLVGAGAVIADRQFDHGANSGGVAAPLEAGAFGLLGLGIAGQATTPFMRTLGIAEAALGLSMAATSGGMSVFDAIRGSEQHDDAGADSAGGASAGETAPSLTPEAGFNAARSIEVQVGPQPHGGTWVELQYSSDDGQPAAKEQAHHVEVTEHAADGSVTFHTTGSMSPSTP